MAGVGTAVRSSPGADEPRRAGRAAAQRLGTIEIDREMLPDHARNLGFDHHFAVDRSPDGEIRDCTPPHLQVAGQQHLVIEKHMTAKGT